MAITNLTSGILSTISQSGWFVTNTNHITAVVALPLYILSGTENAMAADGGKIPPSFITFGNFPAGSGLLSGSNLFYTIFFRTDR